MRPSAADLIHFFTLYIILRIWHIEIVLGIKPMNFEWANVLNVVVLMLGVVGLCLVPVPRAVAMEVQA